MRHQMHHDDARPSGEAEAFFQPRKHQRQAGINLAGAEFAEGIALSAGEGVSEAAIEGAVFSDCAIAR